MLSERAQNILSDDIDWIYFPQVLAPLEEIKSEVHVKLVKNQEILAAILDFQPSFTKIYFIAYHSCIFVTAIHNAKAS